MLSSYDIEDLRGEREEQRRLRASTSQQSTSVDPDLKADPELFVDHIPADAIALC